MTEPTVTQLITAAFAVGAARTALLNEAWVGRSASIGGRLPGSLLMVSVQRLGRLDLVLRCMEIEREIPPSMKSIEEGFALDCQLLLSEAWIGAAYEIVRVLKERDVAPPTADFRLLAHDLRLIRVALEKYEIADDKKLKEALRMANRGSHGQAEGLYNYVRGDKSRAHIMPTALSERGSASWHVVDLAAEESSRTRWLERLALSDRFLATSSTDAWGSAP